MFLNNIHTSLTINKPQGYEIIKLLPIVSLAFFIALIPHLNYPYLVHIDEWMHLSYIQTLINTSDFTIVDPFFGSKIFSLTEGDLTLGPQLEYGFHAFCATFHQITDIDWLSIFKYTPSVIFVFTVLSTYIMANKFGFGWFAAFIVSLLPTTVGILGPGFLVPSSIVLLFIPLALFLVYHIQENVWIYFVLFIFICFLLITHAVTAIILAILIIPFSIIVIKKNTKHSFGLLITVATPFVLSLPWTFNLVISTIKQFFSLDPIPQYVDYPSIIILLGYVIITLCLFGILSLALRKTAQNYGLVFGLLLLLVILTAKFTFNFGLSILYTRGVLAATLMISIVAGAGISFITSKGLIYVYQRFKNASLRINNTPIHFHKYHRVKNYISIVFILVVIIAVLITTLPMRLSAQYYHMINEEDFNTFIWIRDNVEEKYSKAILDPWKATAFTAITGKNVCARIHNYPDQLCLDVYEFLENDCTDTSFLKEHKISVIYTRGNCSNPELTQIKENVYLFKWHY